MATLDMLLDEARPDLYGAPDPSIERAALDAAIELCRQSHWWRADLDPIELVSGRFEYELESPEPSSRVERVIAVSVGTCPIDAGEYGAVSALIRGGAESGDRGVPRYWSPVPSLRAIRVHPIPGDDQVADGDTLHIRGVLVPTRRATRLPDQLVEEFFDALVAGAKERLQRIPDKPWTDPQGALWNREIFYRGIGRAKRDALSGGWRGDLYVMPPPF